MQAHCYGTKAEQFELVTFLLQISVCVIVAHQRTLFNVLAHCAGNKCKSYQIRIVTRNSIGLDWMFIVVKALGRYINTFHCFGIQANEDVYDTCKKTILFV